MTRIAFFGPLPPLNTGIADYDEAVLPILRKDFEVDVFLERTFPGQEGFSHADFFSKHYQNPYDLTLYQMGNSLFHEYMYGYLFQNPGVVIFHDYCLLHSRSEMLLEKACFQEYREELAAVYPEQAEQIADTIISSAAGDLLFYQFPFFELVLRSSLAAAAHTEVAVKKLSTPQTPVIKIPHLELPGADLTQQDPAPEKFVIATFGYVTGAKRISTLLEVIAEIGKQHSEVITVIVGDVEDRAALNQQVESLGLGNRVIVTKRLPITEFLQWMGRADVIVNLRYPSAGEMSGTLIRSLASAKPVIISRLPGLQEIPEDAVLRVRPDEEKADLRKALRSLITNGELRKKLSANARNYILKHHSAELVRTQYRKLIELAMERKAHFQGIDLPVHLQSGKAILRNSLRRGPLKDAPGALKWLADKKFCAG